MKKRKTLIFYFFLAVAFLLPTSMSAQSLFMREGKTQTQTENAPISMFGKAGESAPSYPGIGNQGFNQDAPLSSGVLMLIAAGAGYAVIKKKKSKKSSITF